MKTGRYGLMDAMGFAAIKHDGQRRRYTGEPYIAHCMRVTENLAALGKYISITDEMLMAAVLHDTVEDTDCTIDDIRGRYGDIVAEYVFALSIDPEAGSRRQRYAKYTAQLHAAPAPVQYIKACDIMDNLAGIRAHDPDFFIVYQREACTIAAALDKLHFELREKLASEIGLPECIAAE